MIYRLIKLTKSDVKRLVDYKKLGFKTIDESESRYYMKYNNKREKLFRGSGNI